MIKLLLQYYLRRIVRFFSTRSLAKAITAVLFLLVLVGLSVGIFFFFKFGFLYIAADPYLKSAMTLYVYELCLLMVVYLIILSAFISGLFRLFKSREDYWILATPQFRLLPSYIFGRVFVSCLWPLLVIVLPAILAIRSVYGLNPMGLIFSFLLVILLAALVVCLVKIVLLGLGKILYHCRLASGQPSLMLRNLVIGVILFLIIISLFTWQQITATNLVDLFHAEDLGIPIADIDTIKEQFRLFPSHLVAAGIFALQNGAFSQVGWDLLKLFIFLIVAFLVFWRLSFWYLPLWQTLQENRFEARTKVSTTVGKPVRFPRFFKGKIGAIFEKEALISARNMRNLLWFGFLFFIWLVQTGLNVFLSRNITRFDLAPDRLPEIILVLQFVTIVYFISAFVLRFAFPSFSAERRTAWIMASAPINLKQLFWAKLFFYCSVFILLGLAVSLVNISILNLSLIAAGLIISLFLISIVFLTIIGLSLGALFPNFTTDDPGVLSTTLPGLGFILGSLIYGAVGAFGIFIYLKSGSIWPIVFFEIGSMILILVFLYFTPRSLKKVEFIKNLA